MGALWVVSTVEMIKWNGLHTVIKSNWAKEDWKYARALSVHVCAHVCVWVSVCMCVDERVMCVCLNGLTGAFLSQTQTPPIWFHPTH